MLHKEDIKARVDLFDLAEKLGLERPQASGNYRSPHHTDKSPSLSIFDNGRAFQDFSSDGEPNSKGDCISLVMYVQGISYVQAIRVLHDLYGWEYSPKPDPARYQRVESQIEYIAKQALREDPTPMFDYLTEERCIPRSIVQWAYEKRAIGYSTFVNSKAHKLGEVGYGGPSAVSIVRDPDTRLVVATDDRYMNPDLNGGSKTRSLGDKVGYPWTVCLEKLRKAAVVYVVEGWINALSIEACEIPGAAAIATRGGAHVTSHVPWVQFQGKQVCLAFDADQPNKFGNRAGDMATWAAYDGCVAADVSVRVINRMPWYENDWNDLNDILKDRDRGGIGALGIALKNFEPFAIAGLPAYGNDDKPLPPGRARIFLPRHDARVYWRYQVEDDFTTFLARKETKEDGETKVTREDVCGFRVASVNRVKVASPTSVFSGQADTNPIVKFAVSVKVPREDRLKRQVFADEKLYSQTAWEKFGPIFSKKRLDRLVNILERTAGLASRTVVNIVGLANRDGELIVSEGPDCYFTTPKQQCPYHELVFPRGPVSHAQKLLIAYSKTFKANAALQVLIWSLGGHLKVFLGFWPHLTLQAPKAAGKSTLLAFLQQHLAMTVFSSSSADSAFRVQCALSNTLHPVGMEEISANDQRTIDATVKLLQEAYTYSELRRNSDLNEHTLCAPALITGEDVPVSSLLGKLVRVDLSNRKAEPLTRDLPSFPVRAWLDFLARQDTGAVRDRFDACLAECRQGSTYATPDGAADRIMRNYAAVLLCWRLLVDFARMHSNDFQFESHWFAEMDRHLSETESEREPWVRIMEITLHEIDTERYRSPYLVEDYKGNRVLFIRHRDIMHHLSSSMALRQIFDASPIKSASALKKAMMNAGVVIHDDVQRSIKEKRWGRLLALSIDELAKFKLEVSDHCSVEAKPPEQGSL